ncbi:MAG TPA: IS21 family transposase [Solirubrobacteraceae bacterium]|nr:IS21 family transposase [Solirubrobacteraceae bacterium]
MVGVEQWAEIRRMHRVERLSIRAISKRTGLHRKTVRRALAAQAPPRYVRARAGSKLDPFREWICEQLRGDPSIQSLRLREMAVELGYVGGKTIFDDYVREVRPRFARPRTFQRTIYRPGELIQCDLWEPRAHVPVGHGQLRRGWVVTAEVCWSRVIAGSLIFSKEAPDILWGLNRCLTRLGVLPEKLVWDREGAIAGGGRPTADFACFCGQLEVGWVILDAGDPQAKGVLERSHRFMRSNFEPGRRFANPADFQLQFDSWCDRANRRVHRTIRAVPAERLAEERERMRPLPDRMPDTDRRHVLRVPAQPYVRVDRNDYSIDPAFVGRRVEVRVGQEHITAAVLDTGELACRHHRSFAGGLTFTDPAHQTELERQRARRRRRHEVDVEIRPLSRYDQLIPA